MMHQNIGTSISSMGIISMVISGGTIVSSLLSDKLTHRFGTQWVTTVSVFMTAVALMGFSYSNSLWMLILFALPYGLGAGAIDAALNNYVALHYSSKHMSWLHCFWGVGTIISPFVMSFALTHSTWNLGYRIIAYIQLAIAIILLSTLSIWKNNNSTDKEMIEKSNSLSIIGAINIKGVPYLLIGFFSYCAAEGTAMAWSCTYLVEVKKIDEPTSAAFASCFFIGMTIGRFLGGFIMDKLGDRNMILLGTSIALLGVAFLLLPSTNHYISLIGLIIIGLGCAPIYPCIIHSTPFNFGAENSGSIIGIQMASAYMGTTFIPPLFGIFGKTFSFVVFPLYISVFILIMILMIEKTFRITK